MTTLDPEYVRLPLRRRLEEATQLELTRLADVLKVRLSSGGASGQSRLEVAFFDSVGGALHDVLAPPPTYEASVAAALMVLREPGGAPAGVIEAVKKLVGDRPATPRVQDDDVEVALALGERAVLDAVRRQLAVVDKKGKGTGLDGLSLRSPAPWGAQLPALSKPGMFAHRRSIHLVRTVVLTSAIAERIRLERELRNMNERVAA